MTSPAQPALLPGESVRYHAALTPRLILKHLKTTLVVTDRRVIVQEPNTLFGLIPMGHLEQSAPLSSVVTVNDGEHTSSRNLLFGSISAFMALYLLIGGGILALGALVFAVIAALLFLTAFHTGISIRTSGGNALQANSGRSERHLVAEAKAQVNFLVFGAAAPAVGNPQQHQHTQPQQPQPQQPQPQWQNGHQG